MDVTTLFNQGLIKDDYYKEFDKHLLNARNLFWPDNLFYLFVKYVIMNQNVHGIVNGTTYRNFVEDINKYLKQYNSSKAKEFENYLNNNY